MVLLLTKAGLQNKSDFELAVSYMVNFCNFYSHDRVHQYEPRTINLSDHTCLENMIILLSHWHSLTLANYDAPLQNSRSNGEYWGEQIARATTLAHNEELMMVIASSFRAMKAEADKTVNMSTRPDWKERTERGPISWLHVQQMDSLFYGGVMDTLLKTWRQRNGGAQAEGETAGRSRDGKWPMGDESANPDGSLVEESGPGASEIIRKSPYRGILTHGDGLASLCMTDAFSGGPSKFSELRNEVGFRGRSNQFQEKQRSRPSINSRRGIQISELGTLPTYQGTSPTDAALPKRSAQEDAAILEVLIRSNPVKPVTTFAHDRLTPSDDNTLNSG